jgi:hypothetical protein
MAADLSKDEDSMTLWIAANLVAPFHQLVGRHFIHPSDHSAGLYNYSDRTITKLSSLVATVLSSVLPIVGVIVLYFVENTLARIGIIAGMTALFSLCLALLTAASKSEIFAATAAFVTLNTLVVFGNTDGYLIASRQFWSSSLVTTPSSISGILKVNQHALGWASGDQ